MNVESINYLKFFTIPQCFLLEHHNLKWFALLKVSRSLISSIDEKLFIIFSRFHHSSVIFIQFLDRVKIKANAQWWIDRSILTPSKRFTEITILILSDVLRCILNIMRIQVHIFLLLHANKVQCLLRFASNESSEPLPTYHFIQDGQVMRFRIIQTQSDQDNQGNFPFWSKTLRTQYLFFLRFPRAFALTPWRKHLHKLIEKHTGVIENYRFQVLYFWVTRLV